MFGLGWAELMLAGVVALIVIGPKELPLLFRKLGQFTGKAKAMARDFSRAMNDAADEAGVKDAVDGVNSIHRDFMKSEPTKVWSNYTPGSETEKFAKEKADTAKKAKEATEKCVAEKRAGEAAATSSDKDAVAKKPVPKKAAAKKAAPTKLAAKKPAAKKAASKKPAPAKSAPAPKAAAKAPKKPKSEAKS